MRRMTSGWRALSLAAQSLSSCRALQIVVRFCTVPNDGARYPPGHDSGMAPDLPLAGAFRCFVLSHGAPESEAAALAASGARLIRAAAPV